MNPPILLTAVLLSVATLALAQQDFDDSLSVHFNGEEIRVIYQGLTRK